MSDPLKIIDGYLGKNTIQGFILVISLLVVIFSLFELLVQLDSVGRGTYRVADASIFMALTIPKRLADLIPMAGLLGSIVSLGLLADRQDITAMRAAGLSAQRISLTVLETSTLLTVAALMVSEFVAPSMEQYARTRRFQAIYGNTIMLTKHGFWTRHSQMFVHVGRTFAGGAAADIEIFEVDERELLRQFTYSRQAAIQSRKDWVLVNAEATVLDEDVITQKAVPEYRLDDFLSSSQVAVLELSPDSLSLSDLYAYIRILERRGQNAERYALAFWQKIFLPASTGVMVLLSLTFVSGSTRMRMKSHLNESYDYIT